MGRFSGSVFFFIFLGDKINWQFFFREISSIHFFTIIICFYYFFCNLHPQNITCICHYFCLEPPSPVPDSRRDFFKKNANLQHWAVFLFFEFRALGGGGIIYDFMDLFLLAKPPVIFKKPRPVQWLQCRIFEKKKTAINLIWYWNWLLTYPPLIKVRFFSSWITYANLQQQILAEWLCYNYSL